MGKTSTELLKKSAAPAAKAPEAGAKTAQAGREGTALSLQATAGNQAVSRMVGPRRLVKIEKYVGSKDAVAYWSDGEKEDVTYNLPKQEAGVWTADVVKGPPGSTKPQLHQGVQVIVRETPEQRIDKLPGYIRDYLNTVGGDREWLAQYGEDMVKQGLTESDVAAQVTQVSGTAPADPDYELVSKAKKAGYSQIENPGEHEKGLELKVRMAKEEARKSGLAGPEDPLANQEWQEDPEAAREKWDSFARAKYGERIKEEAASLREMDRLAKRAMGAVEEILAFEVAGVATAVAAPFVAAGVGAADAAAIRMMSAAPRTLGWLATHPHLALAGVGAAVNLGDKALTTGSIDLEDVAFASVAAAEGDYEDLTTSSMPPGSRPMLSTGGEEPPTSVPVTSGGPTPVAGEELTPTGGGGGAGGGGGGAGGPTITRLPPGPEPDPEPMHIEDDELPEGTQEIRRTPNQQTGSLSDEEQLGANMDAAGRPVEPGHARHHIVLKRGGGYWGDVARERLRDLDVGINEEENGIGLPTYQQRGRVPESEGGPYHGSIHTQRYYREVARRLLDARTEDEARAVLRQIGEDLKNGNFPS